MFANIRGTEIFFDIDGMSLVPEQQRVCQWLWDGNFRTLEQRYEFARAIRPLYSVTFDPEKAEATPLFASAPLMSNEAAFDQRRTDPETTNTRPP